MWTRKEGIFNPIRSQNWPCHSSTIRGRVLIMSNHIIHHHNDDGIYRQGFLKFMLGQAPVSFVCSRVRAWSLVPWAN